MSLLPTTALLWRRCPKLATCARPGRRHLSQVGHDALALSSKTFEDVGLQRSVVTALQDAFPNVRRPTQMQVEFLEAALGGRDVLLKDKTGTGKSFGLLLTLLNRSRKYVRVESSGKYVKQNVTSAVYIAPHRDLVLQLNHWIKSMYDAILHTGPLNSIAQVVLRDDTSPIADQVKRIQAEPPHILLGTPQAILEALQLETDPLSLRYLLTVVVDEADYLLEHKPKAANKYDVLKYERMIKKHPSVTRQVLNTIYRTAPPLPQKPSQKTHTGYGMRNAAQAGSDVVRAVRRHRPQLIMTSATLKSGFRSSVLSKENGWFWDTPTIVTPVTVARDVRPMEDTAQTESTAKETFGASSLLHSALVVSENGDIRNIKGAVDVPIAEATLPTEGEKEASAAESQDALPGEASSSGSPSLVTEAEENEFADAVSPFNPDMLEAVAATFAVRVPQLALLVLPATAPVRHAVYELRSLGVNARALDVTGSESGGSFLLKKDTAVADNPTLLVSTLASTRGLDLPNLTHVFILGMPKELTLEEYMHAAGRAGRFGRAGHVISILEPPTMVHGKKGKKVLVNGATRLQQMYKRLRVTPVKIEEFEPVEPAA
ncbi:hypothetical protein EIP86_010482 [Pleurotus ostreatoroseus]|nr:hypothetical protein EIP86_010482 [Pleurotus ostreatoroseus]